MKNFFLLLMALTFSNLVQGQVRLNLQWNAKTSLYEVYAISPTTQKNFPLGKAKVGVVVPASAPDSPLKVQSVQAGNWSDIKWLAKPEAATASDFHSLETSGGVINLNANQPLLLFTFTFSDGQCREGVRLFNNGSDPGPSAKGLNQLDFSNSILGGGNVQVYHSNVSNSGTTCMDCPVEFTVPKLKKQS